MTRVDLLPESVRAPGRHAVAVAREGRVAPFPGSSQLPGEPPRYWDNMLTPLQRDEDGKVTSILCMSRDVTLQRETEMRLELAVRATDDAICDWDILREQDALERSDAALLGYAAQNVGETTRTHPCERSHARS